MTRSTLTCRYALAVALASLLGVAGCGSSSTGNGESAKTGPQVVKDAAAALGAAGASHIKGTVADSGKAGKVDLQLQSDGTSGMLTIAGSSVTIVSVGGAVYLKAPAAFWVSEKATAAGAALLGGRWIKLPTSSEIETLTLAGVAKSLAEPDSGTKIEDKVTTGTLNGQKVVIVRESDGSLLYVAATGKPYPLRATNDPKSKDGPGDASFSGFGRHTTITAPAGAIDESAAPA